MAGTVTHHKFSIDVEDKLNKSIPINSDLFHLACQGHDLGFFFKWYNLKLRKQTHEFSIKYLEDCYFLEYIYHYIKYIKHNRLKDNTDVKNFLYGYIAHHYLDSYVHPYIINKTGVFDVNNPATFKYLGKHDIYETMVDKKKKEKYFNNSPVHKIFPKHIFINNSLLKTNQSAFIDTYNNKKFGPYYVNAMNDVYSFLLIFRNDPTKLKLLMYKTIDLILKQTNHPVNYEFLSFSIKPIDYKELITSERWNDPVTNERNYNSFMELYDMALKLVIKVIEELENIIMDNKKDAYMMFSGKIPDRSAIHGYECDQNYTLKYFK